MDNGFSSEWIEKLKNSNDIVTTLSKYITLNKKGKTWWACCPFHFEKTPSFAVNEVEQYYHCFGCGASGDVIKFVEKYENVDFMEANKILAEYANLALPEFTADDSIALKKKKVDRLHNLLKDTAKYYFNNLKSPLAKPAIQYLESRKLNNESINAFGIGYSFGWDEVIVYLKKLGYTEQEMLEAGVIENKNNKYYDCYAKRLIFPLFNSYGNVLGFSARILEKKDFAKYKNTAQTIVFDKSKCVYGINLLKKYKQNNDLTEIIIVEGQIDVISLYKNNIRNVVACLGTALTSSHAKELKRFSDKAILCFDGDGAGIKATLRSIEVLVNNNFNVFVANIPDGKDPDEYVNTYGKDKFLNIMSNAKYWVEYLITKYSKDFNLNKPEEKHKFVVECLNVIKNLSTESEQDIYLDMLYKLTGINKSVLRGDLGKNPQEITVSSKTENKNDNVVTRENAYVKAVKFVMSALLNKKEYATLNKDIKDNLFNSDYLKIYEYIEEALTNNTAPIIRTLFTMFDVENNPDVNDLISYECHSEYDNAQYYADCIKTLKSSGLSVKQRELLNQIRDCKDPQKKKELFEQLNHITMMLKK